MYEKVEIINDSDNDLSAVEEQLQDIGMQLQADFYQQLAIDKEMLVEPYERSERISFDHIILEINDNPSVTPVFISLDNELLLIDGPRLDLHLARSSGLQNTRHQLGRIARYACARNLQDEYPFIVATSYPKLIRIAQLLIPGMCPASATFFADRGVEQDINVAFDIFSKKHNRIPYEKTATSLVMTTEDFVQNL